MARRYKDRPPDYERFHVKNWSTRGGAKVHGIMCHTTESADVPATDHDLDGIQNWFNNPASEASSWIGVDGDANSRLWVPGFRKAWTMGDRKVNAETLNIEFVGRANQPAKDWEVRQLKHGAKWAAYAILNYDFVLIDPDHIRRAKLNGTTFVVNGIGTHKDLTDQGIGTHTDPGVKFPMDDFIGLIVYYIKRGWTKES